MANSSNPWVLFGLDLTVCARFFRLGIQQLLYDESSWLARRFQPLIWAKVGKSWQGWNAAGQRASRGSTEEPLPGGESAFIAATVPTDAVLFKRLQLPQSEEAYLAGAVRLETEVSSPFPLEDLVVGWRLINRGPTSIDVLIAMTSQQAAQKALEEHEAQQGPASFNRKTSLVTINEEQHIVQFAEFADPEHDRCYKDNIRRNLLTLGIIVTACCILIVLPGLSSAYRAGFLSGEFQMIRQDARATELSIEQLHLQQSRLNTILEAYQTRPDYAERLEGIAQSTPDGTFLESMTIEGAEIEVNGYSDNAANYLRLLTEQEGYSSVTARSAFLREPRSGLERFDIDWVILDEGA